MEDSSSSSKRPDVTAAEAASAFIPKTEEPVEVAVDPVIETIILDDAGVSDDTDPMAKLAKATGINDPAVLGAIISAATQQLVSAHKAEIDALRQELQDFKLESDREGKVNDLNESMGGYPWQYYRFGPTFPDEQRRGWISIAPGGASPKDGHRDAGSFNLYVKKGMIPITNRGVAPVPTNSEVWRNFVEFVKRGGAADFAPSQIISYQWHRKNPFAKMGVRWTQVEDIIDKLTSWTCEYCGYSMDFMPNDPQAGTAYRVHLTNADKVTFREAIEAVNRQNLTVTPFRPRPIEEIKAMARP